MEKIQKDTDIVTLIKSLKKLKKLTKAEGLDAKAKY